MHLSASNRQKEHSVIFNGNPLTDLDFDYIFDKVNAPRNTVRYLGIDPGEKNGVCGYDVNYNLVFMWTIAEADMLKFLDCFGAVLTCVIENFTLYPNKAMKQVYSEMTTSRVIGRVEGWAARERVDLVKQPASIKKTGYAWIGKKPPSKSDPDNHVKDAHVHFMYWAVKNRRLDASILLDLNRRGT